MRRQSTGFRTVCSLSKSKNNQVDAEIWLLLKLLFRHKCVAVLVGGACTCWRSGLVQLYILQDLGRRGLYLLGGLVFVGRGLYLLAFWISSAMHATC